MGFGGVRAWFAQCLALGLSLGLSQGLSLSLNATDVEGNATAVAPQAELSGDSLQPHGAVASPRIHPSKRGNEDKDKEKEEEGEGISPPSTNVKKEEKVARRGAMEEENRNASGEEEEKEVESKRIVSANKRLMEEKKGKDEDTNAVLEGENRRGEEEEEEGGGEETRTKRTEASPRRRRPPVQTRTFDDLCSRGDEDCRRFGRAARLGPALDWPPTKSKDDWSSSGSKDPYHQPAFGALAAMLEAITMDVGSTPRPDTPRNPTRVRYTVAKGRLKYLPPPALYDSPHSRAVRIKRISRGQDPRRLVSFGFRSEDDESEKEEMEEVVVEAQERDQQVEAEMEEEVEDPAFRRRFGEWLPPTDSKERLLEPDAGEEGQESSEYLGDPQVQRAADAALRASAPFARHELIPPDFADSEDNFTEEEDAMPPRASDNRQHLNPQWKTKRSASEEEEEVERRRRSSNQHKSVSGALFIPLLRGAGSLVPASPSPSSNCSGNEDNTIAEQRRQLKVGMTENGTAPADDSQNDATTMRKSSGVKDPPHRVQGPGQQTGSTDDPRELALFGMTKALQGSMSKNNKLVVEMILKLLALIFLG